MNELTPREAEALKLLAETHGDRQLTADRMGISHHTLKDHIDNIFSKLGVNNMVGAVIEGMRRDFIPLP